MKSRHSVNSKVFHKPINANRRAKMLVAGMAAVLAGFLMTTPMATAQPHNDPDSECTWYRNSDGSWTLYCPTLEQCLVACPNRPGDGETGEGGSWRL